MTHVPIEPERHAVVRIPPWASTSRALTRRIRTPAPGPLDPGRSRTVERWRWRKESPPWDRGRSAAGMVLRGGDRTHDLSLTKGEICGPGRDEPVSLSLRSAVISVTSAFAAVRPSLV